MKYVGLSVSFCVKNICQGHVAIKDVVGIVPGMVLNDNNTIWDVYDRYKDIYWKNYAELARSVLEQVEILDHPGHRPNVSNGVWLKAEDYNQTLDLQNVRDIQFWV